jgi:CopG family nickel-responsive transcriptional regulator
MDIRHEFEASIRSNSHDCLEGNAGCVETFVVEAAYDDALRFIGTVRGADESISVEYTVVPVDELSVEVGEH